MSKSGQLRVSRTDTIPVPNEYILALQGEYAPWSYDEQRAPRFRGRWREDAFAAGPETPLDLEIGTGNGLHFAHHAIQHPGRCVLGLELKYKPLIQSIRRCRRAGQDNARMARYNAYLLPELFAEGELDDVFIFFPDPWEKSRQHKHRLIQDEFLEKLFKIQRPGSRLIFKTDSPGYFDWALERFLRGPYKVTAYTHDLHKSVHATSNFVTQFESIFIRQGLSIGWACLERGREPECPDDSERDFDFASGTRNRCVRWRGYALGLREDSVSLRDRHWER
ncbi:MAG: tRNA (guanine-N7)-methyltransferase [Calothrix sp. SM1_5_4]|nr:tRNA (guanine-N7)-methyltransferase [Calothrix sp. SM1_5_4]